MEKKIPTRFWLYFQKYYFFLLKKKIANWNQVKITTMIYHRFQILPRFGRDPLPFWSYYYLYSWIPKMKHLLQHQIVRNQRLRLMPIKRKGTKEGKIFMSTYVYSLRILNFKFAFWEKKNCLFEKTIVISLWLYHIL